MDISGDSKDIPDYATPDAGIVLANFPPIIPHSNPPKQSNHHLPSQEQEQQV